MRPIISVSFLLWARLASGEAKARRLIIQKLAELGWSEADLRKHRKGAPAKVELARRLRKETTLSLKWIAEELHMGSWTYVSNLLRNWRKSQ